ncbi:hypothetical protein ILYODFUR_009024 [Ilyodon furcidens]|uniref:Uncharacterized protein n=1 Tax=Ilyodon furcidens TaxID=33524 RepID=A0ABV0V570_9TELE
MNTSSCIWTLLQNGYLARKWATEKKVFVFSSFYWNILQVSVSKSLPPTLKTGLVSAALNILAGFVFFGGFFYINFYVQWGCSEYCGGMAISLDHLLQSAGHLM